MARSETTASKKPLQTLRKAALRHPETEEGVACEGTALEKRTIKTHGKAFVFLGSKAETFDVMLKLRESLAEATKLAKKDPAHYRAAASGWVNVVFRHDETAPIVLLTRWIYESYEVFAAVKKR